MTDTVIAVPVGQRVAPSNRTDRDLNRPEEFHRCVATWTAGQTGGKYVSAMVSLAGVWPEIPNEWSMLAAPSAGKDKTTGAQLYDYTQPITFFAYASELQKLSELVETPEALAYIPLAEELCRKRTAAWSASVTGTNPQILLDAGPVDAWPADERRVALEMCPWSPVHFIIEYLGRSLRPFATLTHEPAGRGQRPEDLESARTASVLGQAFAQAGAGGSDARLVQLLEEAAKREERLLALLEKLGKK